MSPLTATPRHSSLSHHVAGVASLFLLLAGSAPVAGAQRADSTRAGVTVPAVPRQPADSLLRPPISPRRAFLSSLLFPGAGQAALRRPVAGSIYVGAEMLSLFMIAKSREDLRLAKVAPDSIITGYEVDENDEPVLDPETGEPIPILAAHPLPPRVRARRQHLEDWFALLIFNHFFSAADAFVAAHLWEVPARVSVQPRPDGVAVSLNVAW